MENQIQLITEFLDDVGAGYYSTPNVEKYVEWNLRAKAKLNDVIGLNLDNGLTKVIPITMTNQQIMDQYQYLNTILFSILPEGKYHSIDYVAGTCKNQKGQEVRLTRIIPKFKEQIQGHSYYRQACQEIGISDYKFESLCPRLGELANSSNQELFITSSIAEFMRVNYHSSYCSCYKHQAYGGTSYWTGTLAYGTDDFSLLVGIRNKTTKYKTGRSWLWAFPDGIDSSGVNQDTPFMVQPKSYGEFSKLHRKAVREAIQDCIQPGKWGVFVDDEDNKVHHDYRYGYIDNYDLTISYAKGKDKPQKIYIDFGMSADSLFCLSCGCEEDLSDGSGQCNDCANDYHCYCSCCEEGLSEDDVYYGADDSPYCQHCYNDRFFYCECCGDTAWIENSERVTGYCIGRSYTERVCEHCLKNGSISECSDCGNYFFDDEVPLKETVDGDYVCEDCSEGYCDCCELAFARGSEAVDLANGKSYCVGCTEDSTFTCVECGELFDNDEESETEGLCVSCFEKLQQLDLPLVSDSECLSEAA